MAIPCRLETAKQNANGSHQPVCVKGEVAKKPTNLAKAKTVKTTKVPEAPPLETKIARFRMIVDPRKKLATNLTALGAKAEIKEFYVGMQKDKGFVGVHMLEASGPKGQMYLEKNSDQIEKMGFVMIERNGKRSFIAKGHAEGFTQITPRQRTLEQQGALGRSVDEKGNYIYFPLKPAGRRFLNENPKLARVKESL